MAGIGNYLMLSQEIKIGRERGKVRKSKRKRMLNSQLPSGLRPADPRSKLSTYVPSIELPGTMRQRGSLAPRHVYIQGASEMVCTNPRR